MRKVHRLHKIALWVTHLISNRPKELLISRFFLNGWDPNFVTVLKVT